MSTGASPSGSKPRAAASVALTRRAPMIVVVLGAAVVTALARLLF